MTLSNPNETINEFIVSFSSPVELLAPSLEKAFQELIKLELTDPAVDGQTNYKELDIGTFNKTSFSFKLEFGTSYEPTVSSLSSF